MKKYVLILLALVLLLGGCAKEDDPAQPSEDSQKSGTKTVYIRTSHTLSSGGFVTRTEYLLGEDETVEQVVISTNGTETMRYDVENDEHGNYIRWIGQQITSTFHYDEMGRPLGKSVYSGELLISSTEYTWDNSNQVGVADRNGVQEQRTAWFYNDSGHKVREELYQNGVLVNYSQITCNEQGWPTAQTVYLADGTLHSTVSYTYDGQNCTTVTTLADGSVEQRTEYAYDEHGNLLSTTVYDGAGTVISQVTDTWKAIQVSEDSLRASI